MQDELDVREEREKAYEANLLYRYSMHMARNGLLPEAIRKSTHVTRHNIAHAYATVIDLRDQRVLMVDPLVPQWSLYSKQNASEPPTWSIGPLQTCYSMLGSLSTAHV